MGVSRPSVGGDFLFPMQLANADDEEIPHPLCFFVPGGLRSVLHQWWLAIQREAGFADVVDASAEASTHMRDGVSVSPLRMSVALRKKLSRGAHYNLKLLVRGDLQTGKTQLWRRLQGLPFAQAVPASTSLGVANIDWADAASPDVVKVEAWDVCDGDLARAGKGHQGLAFEQHGGGGGVCGGSSSSSSPRSSGRGGGEANANAWRDAHAAVLLFDPRKPWTWAYVLRMFEEAPREMPLLVLCGFADQCLPADVASPEAPPPPPQPQPPSQSPQPAVLNYHHHRPQPQLHPWQVKWADVEQALRDERQRSGRALVCVREFSSLDCRGLPAVHAFLQLPYLALVQASHAKAKQEATDRFANAEAALHALAVTGEGAGGAAPDASSPSHLPSTPGSTSARPTPTIGTLPATPTSAAASAPPKLAPPPASTPPSSAHSNGHGATVASSSGAVAMMVAPLDAASIDDSFFDGLDAPASPSASAASSAPPPPPAAPHAETAAQADDAETEVMDMLPLLDDPDDSFYDD